MKTRRKKRENGRKMKTKKMRKWKILTKLKIELEEIW